MAVDGPTGRRRYDSPVRRERMAETRASIVRAGSELVHELPSWDWTGLTFRAVAERAGVGERTVYRHFPTERHLHEAVMARLEQEAGVDYGGMELDTVAAVAELVLASLTSFRAAPPERAAVDASLAAEDDRRRRALRAAVDRAVPHLSAARRESAAAALDVAWDVAAYQRLVGSWGFDHRRSSEVLAWLVDVVAAAIAEGPPPPAARRR